MEKIKEYKEIMKRYRDGEFGKDNLSVFEILERTGKPNLLNDMSISELEELLNSSTGVIRELFLKLIQEKEKK